MEKNITSEQEHVIGTVLHSVSANPIPRTLGCNCMVGIKKDNKSIQHDSLGIIRSLSQHTVLVRIISPKSSDKTRTVKRMYC